MHAIGVSEGVMLLEFEGLNQKEQPPVEEQEVQALEGGANDKELLECLEHRPSSFFKGKLRSILSLPCFTNITLSIYTCLMH
jgi:hypothetical protein